jgi:hypothetical protein
LGSRRWACLGWCWFPKPWLMISEGWSLCYATQYMWDYHNPWAEKPFFHNQYCSAGDAEKWLFFAKTWGALAEANDAQRLQMLEARLDAWTSRNMEPEPMTDHIGSMVLVHMLTWLGYIDGIHGTPYSSTMDPSWDM